MSGNSEPGFAIGDWVNVAWTKLPDRRQRLAQGCRGQVVDPSHYTGGALRHDRLQPLVRMSNGWIGLQLDARSSGGLWLFNAGQLRKAT